MTPFGNPSGKGRGPSKERGPSSSSKGPSADPRFASTPYVHSSIMSGNYEPVGEPRRRTRESAQVLATEHNLRHKLRGSHRAFVIKDESGNYMAVVKEPATKKIVRGKESGDGAYVINGRRYTRRYAVLNPDGGVVLNTGSFEDAKAQARYLDKKNSDVYTVYDSDREYMGEKGRIIYDSEVGDI